MPNIFRMPLRVSYVVPGGVPVYYVDAQNKAMRPVAGDIRTFILHDTDGRDSRQELYDSERKVSVHYLVGEYRGYDTPICIKYASERHEQTFGAGLGSVGGVSSNLNATTVNFELEHIGQNDATRQAFACVVAHSLANWVALPKVPVLLPHWLVDARKTDPRYNWTDMLSHIYSQLARL